MTTTEQLDGLPLHELDFRTTQTRRTLIGHQPTGLVVAEEMHIRAAQERAKQKRDDLTGADLERWKEQESSTFVEAIETDAVAAYIQLCRLVARHRAGEQVTPDDQITDWGSDG